MGLLRAKVTHFTPSLQVEKVQWQGDLERVQSQGDLEKDY
jgi:phage gp45-like